MLCNKVSHLIVKETKGPLCYISESGGPLKIYVHMYNKNLNSYFNLEKQIYGEQANCLDKNNQRNNILHKTLSIVFSIVVLQCHLEEKPLLQLLAYPFI